MVKAVGFPIGSVQLGRIRLRVEGSAEATSSDEREAPIDSALASVAERIRDRIENARGEA